MKALYSGFTAISAILNRVPVNQLAVSVFCIVLLLFSFGTISYNDFFWHFSLGKWMFETKSLLTHDIFSQAFTGKLWLNNTWLFDGALYLLYSSMGLWSLSLLRLVIFGATYWFLYKTIRLKSTISLLIILSAFLITIPVIRNFLRPEITSPLFTSFFLYALFKYKNHASKLIYALPLVEVIWVNTHGGFTLGVLLTGIFFGAALMRALVEHRDNVLQILKKREVITLAVVCLLTFAATFINPYGGTIYILLQNILSDRESLVAILEWQPLSWSSFLSLSLNGQLSFILFGWLGASLLIGHCIRSIARNKNSNAILRDLAVEDITIFVVLLASTMRYVRGMHLFTLIAMLIVLKRLALATYLRRITQHMPVRTGPIVLIGTLVFVLMLQQDAMRLNQGHPFLKNTPESATFLLEHKPSGNILNEYGTGSELVWLLYPEYKVFIDGRTPNVYDGQFYWYYRNMTQDTIFQKLVADYNLTTAMVPHGWNLAPYLESKEWKLVFFDNAYSIYLSPDEDNAALMNQFEYRVLKPILDETQLKKICSDPQQKGELQQELTRNIREVRSPIRSFTIASKVATDCNGSPEELQVAEQLMLHTIAQEPGGPEHYFNLANVQLKLNKEKEAIENFKRSINIAKNKQNMTGYAIALHNLGAYTAANRVFKRTLYAPGDFPNEYYQIYGRTSYQLDNNQKAVDLFHRYLDLIGEENATAQDYLDISHAYYDLGSVEKADAYQAKAQALTATTTDDTI